MFPVRTLAFLASFSVPFKFPSNSGSKTGQPCTTPQKERGLCVLLENCSFLIEKLREKDPWDTSVADIIRRSHCGFVGKMPYVCCPSHILDGTNPATISSRPENVVSVLPNSGNGGAASGNNWDPEEHPNLELLRRDICGDDLSDKILGGKEAGLQQFPWMALLQRNDDDGPVTVCGGSLISERYVMSAAHCFNRDLKGRQIMVLLGEHNILTDPDCEMHEFGQTCGDPVQSFSIEEVTRHPRYNRQNNVGDIALIRLNRTVTLSDYISPICLPAGELLKKLYIKDKLFVAGWGFTENETLSNVKQWVIVPVVSNSECGEVYLRSFDETLMCAGGVKKEDSCRSDSGGPLMKVESVVPSRPGAQWVAVGIVVAGASRCGTEGKPGVYTRVGPFINWILNNLKP